MGAGPEDEKAVATTTENHPIGAEHQENQSIEAPVNWKAYMLCAFASVGGIFFGYDSGYINGVNGTDEFIKLIEGEDKDREDLTDSHTSAIVSSLSAGTFFGALAGGDLADVMGRKWVVILGCFIYAVGVAVQVITGPEIGQPLACIVAGRVIAGVGVGFESAIVILYMSEICPKKIRGALVAGYQFCITIGLLLASCICYGTERISNTTSYRIPIAIQWLWALILGGGLLFLPDSPRYYVKKGRIAEAAKALSRVRDQPEDSIYVQSELQEIISNEEYERSVIPTTDWFSSWAQCFKGSLWDQGSNLRRTILGTSIMMMQQWTGINFIMYYSTPFLESTGAFDNSFLMSLIFSAVNVCSTPLSFWTIERFGRRTILLWGCVGMLIMQFLVAVIGVTVGFNHTHMEGDEEIANNVSAVNAQVAFIAIFIFFFACTWGPGGWVLAGEIFPLPIRSRGVALATASNWLWNTIIAVITPYLTGEDNANLKSTVFFIWGSTCAAALVYTYFVVPETKGLSLEEVDQMFAESTPRTSAKWRPHAQREIETKQDV